MSGSQDYSEVVAQAEKAVASVKDPDLKRIAFQKILDDLLGSRPTSKKVGAPSKATSKSKNTGSAGSKTGPKAYIEELIEDDFFQKPKTISEVRTALENHGHHIAVTSLSGPLQKLCQQRQLRRQKNDSGTYTYSKW
jgi:membrane protein involved in colicin uptake